MKVALLVVVLLVGSARAEPSDRTLVLVGLGMAPPTYLLGVGLHEGSHALGALIVGGTVDSVHLFPPGRDPKSGRFRFGWTYVHALHGKGERIFFYLAPKITDALLLGGFGALVLADAWPSNKYGQLALTVLATGWWIDFAKDVLLFHKGNDVVKVDHDTAILQDQEGFRCSSNPRSRSGCRCDRGTIPNWQGRGYPTQCFRSVGSTDSVRRRSS